MGVLRSTRPLAPIATALLATLLLHAQQPTAAEVLQKLRASYAALTAVHLVVEREETTYPHGRMITTDSQCELAAKTGNTYFARLRLGGGEAVAVSDGNSISKSAERQKAMEQSLRRLAGK